MAGEKGWSTVPSKKGGKKTTKKALPEDIDEPVEAEADVSQYGPGKKLPMHPKSTLDEDTVLLLKPIFGMTEFLRNTFSGYRKENGCYEALLASERLTYATIFCFKIIGSSVKRAIERLESQGLAVPLFWRQLLNLRNALIHHVVTETLSDKCLRQLGIIVTDWSQIYDYFKVICDQGHTEIEEKGGKRYKRFHDVIELGMALRAECPKKSRGKKDQQTQERYFVLIGNVMGKLVKASNGLDLTEKGMIDLERDNPITFYALQNCIEYVATLTSPGGENPLLTDGTRQRVLSVHKKASKWLDILGDTRNAAMHETDIIEPRLFATNICNMRKLDEVLLLKEASQEKQIKVPEAEQKKSASSSVKIMKQLDDRAPSPSPQVVSVQDYFAPKPPLKKFGIMPKAPEKLAEAGKKVPGNQSYSPKKAPPKSGFKK